ncbi:MAG: hypothetical protein ABGY41_19070 [Candidatus Poribacteria bacterium]
MLSFSRHFPSNEDGRNAYTNKTDCGVDGHGLVTTPRVRRGDVHDVAQEHLKTKPGDKRPTQRKRQTPTLHPQKTTSNEQTKRRHEQAQSRVWSNPTRMRGFRVHVVANDQLVDGELLGDKLMIWTACVS